MTNHTNYLKMKLLSLAAEAREHLIETRVQRRPGRPARLIASENAPGEVRAAGARLDPVAAPGPPGPRGGLGSKVDRNLPVVE